MLLCVRQRSRMKGFSQQWIKQIPFSQGANIVLDQTENKLIFNETKGSNKNSAKLVVREIAPGEKYGLVAREVLCNMTFGQSSHVCGAQHVLFCLVICYSHSLSICYVPSAVRYAVWYHMWMKQSQVVALMGLTVQDQRYNMYTQ